MFSKIKNALKKGLISLECSLGKFVAEEKGASEMVTVIILIVVVIAIAAIFQDQLTDIVSSVFEKLRDALGI